MNLINNEPIVGILGGMGPEATVDLMQRIIRLTPAADDIDHIRCIVDNNPKIPSRIKAIIESTDGEITEDPLPTLVSMARGLEAAGAHFLVMPCNTAHHYADDIESSVDIPLINIVDVALESAKSLALSSGSNEIIILGSPALQITGLYEKKFKAFGLKPIYPDDTKQTLLFDIIKEIKAVGISADIQQRYDQLCKSIVTKKTKFAIIACTELSILKNQTIKTLDAAELLATKVVALAKFND